MKRIYRSEFQASSLVFLLVLGIGSFAGNSTAQTSQTKNAVTKSAAAPKPQKHASSKTSAEKNRNRALAPEQEITGTISYVGKSDKEVTLIGTDGTPYDFCITPKTKVELSGRRASPIQLASNQNKQATVRFVPMNDGNRARDVTVGS